VTRFNWTQGFPHFRPVHFAAIIPNRNSRFSIATSGNGSHPPSILLVPAQSSSEQQSASQLSNVQDLAVIHATPAILCASSDTGQGTSAVVDSAGRILFQQAGGQTWTLSLALWFQEGDDRSRTGYEGYGGSFVLGLAGTLLLAIFATERFIENRREQSCRRQQSAESGMPSGPRYQGFTTSRGRLCT
jgi:hypothetical protein